MLKIELRGQEHFRHNLKARKYWNLEKNNLQDVYESFSEFKFCKTRSYR